jgi:hypothetical protein
MNTSTTWSRIILSITRLISYGYDDFKIVNDNQNAPPMQPVLMAELMRRYDTACIARWRGSIANPEATERRHWVSIHAVLPQRPPGQQQTKQQSKNVPLLLAILTAALMRQYNTACIAR